MVQQAGQTSGYIGARVLLQHIPRTGALLADRGSDADSFRTALIGLGISLCIRRGSGAAPVSCRTRHAIVCVKRSRTCSPD
jgi:hypothetical protein